MCLWNFEFFWLVPFVRTVHNSFYSVRYTPTLHTGDDYMTEYFVKSIAVQYTNAARMLRTYTDV